MFSRRIARRRFAHVLSWGISIIGAVFLWYFVSVSGRVESQFEVPLEYVNIPKDIVVTSGLQDKLTVRIRGPEMLMRSATARKWNYSVNLSHIRAGKTVVPVNMDAGDGGRNFSGVWDRLKFFLENGSVARKFEIIDVQPPRITIVADKLVAQSVTVDAQVRYQMESASGIKVENVRVTPETVVLRGPEKVISRYSRVPVVIVPDPSAAGKVVQQTIVLDTDSLVTPTPASVLVSYTVTGGRKVVEHRCPVHLATEKDRQGLLVQPREVLVEVEVPESLAGSKNYLGQMEVVAVPPPLSPGQARTVPLSFRLPDGMKLLKSSADEVEITLKHE